MNPAYYGLALISAPFIFAALYNWEGSNLGHRTQEERSKSRRMAWICGSIGLIHASPMLFGLWSKAVLG